MIMQRKSRNVFHYEIVIVLAVLLIYGGSQGILLNTASAFIKPVSEALGFPCGSFSAYSGIVTGVSILMIPVFTRLYRSSKLKQIMVVCAVVCGLVPLGYALSSKIWHFYVLAGIQGVFINGIGTAVVAILVNNWFVQKRGVAVGIAYAGSGFIASVAIFFVNWTIDRYNWEIGYIFIAASSLVILLLPILTLLKIHPAAMGLRPYGADHSVTVSQNSNGKGRTSMRAYAGKLSFVMLFAANFLSALVTQAYGTNSMACLADLGHSLSQQSQITSLLMLSMAGGKIAIGWIMDHFGGLAGIWTFCLSSLLASVCMILVPSAGILPAYLMAVLMGTGSTGGHVVASFLANDYWGKDDFSKLFPLLTVASLAGLSLGASIPGRFYDTYGSYQPAWLLMLLLTIIMTVIELAAWYVVHKKKGV